MDDDDKTDAQREIDARDAELRDPVAEHDAPHPVRRTDDPGATPGSPR